jgi:aspartate 1-decarboxylase
MLLEVLRCKIHKAEVTHAQLDYEGSLGIDSAWLEATGMRPYERILIGNISNGNRFETYVIPEEAGSGHIRVNGAAAHLARPGDLLVIMAFAQLTPQEADSFQPTVLILGDQNRTIVDLKKP